MTEKWTIGPLSMDRETFKSGRVVPRNVAVAKGLTIKDMDIRARWSFPREYVDGVHAGSECRPWAGVMAINTKGQRGYLTDVRDGWVMRVSASRYCLTTIGMTRLLMIDKATSER